MDDIIYVQDLFFDVNSTVMSIWQLDEPVLVILRISKYVYAFCTIFQCKFNYNVCLVIGLTCFGAFGSLLICICILYHFQCKFNCDVCLVIEPPCFGYFETLYTFCTVLQCEFNCNICLLIITICFGNFQN
jgi:hypothetical protein